MNKQRINEIIASPGSLQYGSDLGVVNELIHSFPYFSTPYLMLSRMLHNENSIYFDKNLKISAAYIGNREVLYNYIHEKAITDDSKAVDFHPSDDKLINQDTKKDHSSYAVSEHIAPIVPIEKEPEPVSTNESKAIEPQIIKPLGNTVSELFQYPVSDYFGQYYKKSAEPVEAKEIQTPAIPVSVYTLSDKKSFSGWLDALESRSKNAGAGKLPEKPVTELKKSSEAKTLIDKFINTEPKIRPQQLKMYKPEDMAKLSVIEDHHIATETMADIYLKQGLKTKALEIFQQLILKFPEKSGYFAARIREIQSDGSF